MNFLLHRHFAVLELGRAGAGFGAMLPDLVKLVDRRWRARRELTTPREEDVDLADLRRGVEHHLDADVWFHRREEFRLGERETAEAFRRAGTTAPRLVLFAHATWEMLLDGALVRRAGAASIGAALRDETGRFGAASAALVAARAPTEAPSPIAPEPPPWDRLWEGLPGLALGYATAEGVARRLDGMRAAFGLGRAGQDELPRWIEALSSMEPRSDEAFAELEDARTG